MCQVRNVKDLVSCVIVSNSMTVTLDCVCRYLDRDDYVLSLSIPMDCVQNPSEVAAYELMKKELESAGKTVT